MNKDKSESLFPEPSDEARTAGAYLRTDRLRSFRTGVAVNEGDTTGKDANAYMVRGVVGNCERR